MAPALQSLPAVADPHCHPRAPFRVRRTSPPRRGPALAALGLAALLSPWGVPSAAAQPLEIGYAYPHGAYVGPDGDRQTRDGGRAGLAVGHRVSVLWDVEAEAFYEVLGKPSGGDHQFGGAAHALLFLRRWAPFAPFALGGVGVMLGEDYFNNSPSVFGELGGGLTSRIRGTGMSLRIDLRYRHVRTVDGFWDRPLADYSVGLGIVFPIGAPGPPPPRAAAPTVRVPPAPVPDADGDGIGDPRDLCPGTPQGTRVNPAGCTADLDRDGVDDGRDRCPGTAPGTAVNAAGCPKEEGPERPSP